MKHNNNFKYDLAIGKSGENAFAKLLSNSKVEIKVDRKFIYTGNFYVEYWSRGKPSGINTSEADWYVFTTGGHDVFLVVPVAALREAVVKKAKQGNITVGGDKNVSRGVLLTAPELVSLQKKSKKLLNNRAYYVYAREQMETK